MNNKLENLNILKCDAVVVDVASDTSKNLGAFETTVFNAKDATLAVLLEPKFRKSRHALIPQIHVMSLRYTG
jgi:uncharacterized protein YrrD